VHQQLLEIEEAVLARLSFPEPMVLENGRLVLLVPPDAKELLPGGSSFVLHVEARAVSLDEAGILKRTATSAIGCSRTSPPETEPRDQPWSAARDEGPAVSVG
jgi:hypothetical protein